MDKKIAILLAGHSHWGKSRTLRALTDGNLIRRVSVGDRSFWIRRMSNDDDTLRYKEFIDEMTGEVTWDFIAAYCPNFGEADDRWSLYSLERLSGSYDIHVFVLKNRFHSSESVSEQEIATLRRFARTVEVYESRDAEDFERAEAFKNYVIQILSNSSTEDSVVD